MHILLKEFPVSRQVLLYCEEFPVLQKVLNGTSYQEEFPCVIDI